MDFMKTEYEFLDLTDVKEAELSNLQQALFEQTETQTSHHINRSDIRADPSSCSWSTAGPSTVSSSLDSLSGGECEMAPHSPQRGSAPPQHAPAPPPYTQPPPPYVPPPQQWQVAPPNVFVGQVTANVNVHGYMGQYYQHPQPQYAPPPPERAPRTHRRDRRGKRAPSPPAPPPPYYVQYPYYSAAQAQGTPLYHMPMYQPVAYVGHYPYHPYYPEYPMPVEGAEGEKAPEEYPQEMMMEQDAVDAYYAGGHYPGPHYGHPEGPVEYMPQMYLPPPQHPPSMPLIQHQPHHPPHQFNVHAKNFVQNPNKSYTNAEKTQEQKSSPAVASATASSSVDSIPMKELKISTKASTSPKLNDRPVSEHQAKPSTSQSEKVSPVPKVEAPKPTWSSSEVKASETVNLQSQATPPVKTFNANASAASQPLVAPKGPQPVVKMVKGPTAPFSGNKQPVKPSLPPVAVPVQQTVSIPKAPFGNRQKRDGATTRSPSGEMETSERPVGNVEHQKREPLLPASKAPMPISITLNAQGPPLIVTNKSPFGHSRKSLPVVEAPVALQPPPPAPTASDFPPPPTPRSNRGDVAPTPAAVMQQPQPAPGKSWASLFSNKATLSPASLAAPIEEPASPTAASPVSVSIQKPVAKVPPFDASPSPQQAIIPVDKSPLTPKPVLPSATTISYSEKTSVNAVSNSTPVANKAPSPTNEVREAPVQKESAPPALLVQPSPFADDPNSYRMGEFLSKYQLDNRPVCLLPRGLTNRSNYCYVNAILQALIACPPFYNMLKALPYQTRRGKSSTPVIDAMVELCYEFSPLVGRGRARGGEAGALPVQAGAPLDPAAGQKVLRALRPFPGSQEGRQEDAEEFLGCLLNGLNDEMLELMKLVEPEEVRDSNQTNGVITQEAPPEEEDDDEWKVMGPKNKGAVERRWAAGRTPLADIFRGRTRLRTHFSPSSASAPSPAPPSSSSSASAPAPSAPFAPFSAALHDASVTDAVQPFFTLQLDMERANSVKDAIELLAGKDTLEGVSDAWQQLSVEQLPVVLLLHLKCFQINSEGHTAKIIKNVDFPIDLKIDPKVMSSKQKYTSKQRMYKLFAVVYHEGVEAVKGHYLTDTYHGQAGWIRYDDSTVTLVSDSQVLKPKPPRMPYLLMYRRQDTLPASHRPAPKTE